MKVLLWLLALAALVAAERWEEEWTEELVANEPYEENQEDEGRAKREAKPMQREANDEDRYYEELARERRQCCEEEHEHERTRRSAEYSRVPRKIHQYEVQELSEDPHLQYTLPPFEKMLAASAEQHHRAYVAVGNPLSSHYVKPEVSSSSIPIGVHPVPNVVHPVSSIVNLMPEPKNNIIKTSPVNVSINKSVAQTRTPVSVLSNTHHNGAPSPLTKEGDLQGWATDQQHQHQKRARVLAVGGGRNKHIGQIFSHGGKSIKDSQSSHHTGRGATGHKLNEHHGKKYEEAAGKRKKHHDIAGHKGGHAEAAHGHRGAKFDEKKGHKKGHKTKGYHNKYHKDEFHKEHKFYDDFHKSGEHHRYGKFNAKHASNESGKKKAHHVNAGHDFVERGKKGYSNKGHLDADKKGFKGKRGHEEHHQSHSSKGKKGGSEGGKNWAHSSKN